MIYDVRVGALLDGSQEIYTIIQSVEASSPQEAAEQHHDRSRIAGLDFGQVVLIAEEDG